MSLSPNVPHQRLDAKPAAYNRLAQSCCGSWARALYGDPDRCMRLLGDALSHDVCGYSHPRTFVHKPPP
jgi:hypothetical protein